MNITEALAIISDIQSDLGLGLLETLAHLSNSDNLEWYSHQEQLAYRIAMREFSKMFAPVEA